MRALAVSPLTFDELLVRRAEASPDAPAIVSAEMGVLTLGQYADLAGRAARFLADRDIGPGDRIAVWGQNSLAWTVWLAAAAWRGAAVVALHPSLGRDELAAALAQSRPVWLVCDEIARGRALGAIAREVAAPSLRGITVLAGADGNLDIRSIVGKASAPAMLGKADQPLNLQFTSGSTGRPKLVVLSHQALLTNAALTAAVSGIGAEDRLASPLPLIHAAGLSSGLILGIASGALWCISHRFRPDVVLDQVERHRCTVLQGVPTMFKAVMDLVAQRPECDISSLRLGFIGGAPCPADFARKAIDALGLERMAITYGQTEFGPTVAVTDGSEPGALKLTSVGRPLPGTELRIEAFPAGGAAAEGQEGEILVRGPTLMSGYFEDPENTAKTVTEEGWLKTGDLGRVVQGCVQVTGRIKELIIRGGENVSPNEVEQVLRNEAGVAEICVVPLPSEHWGEEICAVMTFMPGAEPDEEALRAACEQRLARFKRPDKYIFRDQLPLLDSGKVNRKAVRDAVASGQWT